MVNRANSRNFLCSAMCKSISQRYWVKVCHDLFLHKRKISGLQCTISEQISTSSCKTSYKVFPKTSDSVFIRWHFRLFACVFRGAMFVSTAISFHQDGHETQKQRN